MANQVQATIKITGKRSDVQALVALALDCGASFSVEYNDPNGGAPGKGSKRGPRGEAQFAKGDWVIIKGIRAEYGVTLDMVGGKGKVLEVITHSRGYSYVVRLGGTVLAGTEIRVPGSLLEEA